MDYSQTLSLLKKFRDQRGWAKFHNFKDLAISVNLEASEILEIFQWQPADKVLNDQEKKYLQDELADTMIYLIYMFDKLGVDPGDAIREKVSYNQSSKWHQIDQK